MSDKPTHLPTTKGWEPVAPPSGEKKMAFSGENVMVTATFPNTDGTTQTCTIGYKRRGYGKLSEAGVIPNHNNMLNGKKLSPAQTAELANAVDGMRYAGVTLEQANGGYADIKHPVVNDAVREAVGSIKIQSTSFENGTQINNTVEVPNVRGNPVAKACGRE